MSLVPGELSAQLHRRQIAGSSGPSLEQGSSGRGMGACDRQQLVPQRLVEDLSEMRVIKAEIEKTKNAYPNIADMVRQKASGETENARRQSKDRSQLRVGIPKVLNIWSTHQFW